MSAASQAPGADLIRLAAEVRARTATGTGADQTAQDVVQAADLLLARAPQVSKLERTAVGLARLDAQQWLESLTESATREAPPGLLAELGKRFVEQAHQVAAAADQAVASPAARDVGQHNGQDIALDDQAEAYGEDARQEIRAARSRRTAATVVLLVGVGAAAYAVRAAGRAATAADAAVAAGRAAGSPWPVVLPPMVVCVAAAVTGVVLLLAAAKHDRAARESRRLQRGLAGLGPYLAPLPPAARHLLRATMAQTLFPRLLDDDDPLRQPDWPPARELLYAVYGVPPPADDEDEPDQSASVQASGDLAGSPPSA
jgi:hypothetical protein